MSRRPRPPLRSPRWLGVGAVSLLLAGCESLPPPAPLPPVPAAMLASAHARTNEEVYLQAWGLVREYYFDPAAVVGSPWTVARNRHFQAALASVTETELYDAINSLMAELHDSHTAASTPQQNREQRSEKKPRSGFQLERVENRWVVKEVLPKSPAEEAGVKAGWIFVAENNVPVGDHPRFERVNGQAVHDSFLDAADRPVTVDMTTRILTTVPPPQERVLEGGVVYLRFDDFEPSSRRWLSDQLKQHREAPAVVIDLRQNPGGGLFSLGISIGELFDHAVDIGTFIHRSGWQEEDKSKEIFSAHYAGKIAVLIGPLSASSSEIFASTLQHYGRATLVGRKSAGAVRGSFRFTLKDGGAVQVSLMDYRALDGRTLEGAGVSPDVAVTTTLADVRAGRDPDLQAALVRLKPVVAANTR